MNRKEFIVCFHMLSCGITRIKYLLGSCSSRATAASVTSRTRILGFTHDQGSLQLPCSVDVDVSGVINVVADDATDEPFGYELWGCSTSTPNPINNVLKAAFCLLGCNGKGVGAVS